MTGKRQRVRETNNQKDIKSLTAERDTFRLIEDE